METNLARTLGFGALILACVIACPAAGIDDDVVSRLSDMPRPWKETPRRPNFAEISATLRFWSEKHPDRFTFETRGKTKEGLPIFLACITDKAVRDDDKQVALITATHSGAERTGTTSIMHFAEWLLGNSREAVETRRKQIVLLMPVVNPWGYETTESNANSQGIDPYSGQRGKAWDLATLMLKEPAKAPEIVALQSVFDEFKPDVQWDMHGVPLRWNGHQVVESCGTAYSNYSLRPWDWRVTEAMNAEARKAGYGIDRGEADTQRLFFGPDMPPLADRLWMGRPFFYTAMYGYARYHTLLGTCEVGYEESGVARLRGLMRTGNRVWDGEKIAGYPVNVMKSLVGQWVMASGQNAAERRRSRVELWQRQGTFTMGVLYPQTDCRIGVALALTAKGAKLLEGDPKKFVANLVTLPNCNAAAIRTFLEAGPETKIYFEPADRAPENRALDAALAIRLRIPYRNPKLCDLRLNGQLLPASASDGFQRWYGDGYTQVQINIPLEKARQSDLLVVTCAYAPDVRREYGWRPPVKIKANLK
ncbi:MAG: M14 family zinc carboxypeptidase [Verrucomicrobiia bacterium]